MPGDSVDQKFSVQRLKVSINKELAITCMDAASGKTKTEIEKSIKAANDQIKILMQQGARLNLEEFPKKLPRADKHISKKGGIELSYWQNNCRAAGYRGNGCHIITAIAEGKLDNLDYYSYLTYATLPMNQLARAVSKYVDKLSNDNKNVPKVIKLLNLLGAKLILTNILSEDVSLDNGTKQTLRQKLEKLFLKQSIEAAVDLGGDFLSKTVEARVADEMMMLRQKTAAKRVAPAPLSTSSSMTEIRLRLSAVKQPQQRRSSIVGGDGKLVGTVQKVEAKSVVPSSSVKYLTINSLVGKRVLAGAAAPRPTHKRDVSSFGEPTPIETIRKEMLGPYKQKLAPIPVVQSRVPTNSKR